LKIAGAKRKRLHYFSNGTLGMATSRRKHIYNYFRLSGPQVNWARVVWEQWSMPRHNFILWLAVLGKLRTKDRLRFFQIDTSCVLCGQMEESHSHLFFTCSWTACFWLQIKLWLRINRRMMTLTSAIRGLHSRGNNLEAEWKESL
jgi:hypothetical protein